MQREDFIVAVDEDGTPATQQIAKIDKNHGEKIALVKFDGTAITTEGKLVRHNWFKGLNLNPAKYADILLTPEEARQIHAAQNRMKIGATSSTPLICYGGSVCPMAASCQPPGTMVLTTNHGEVSIEDLDPDIHRLVSFRRQSAIVLGTRDGYTFKKYSRYFSGKLVRLSTDQGLSHDCTPDHISLVRWAENALNKFCVYLMQKDKKFRIGKTRILREYSQGLRFGPSTRALAEKADKVWILGVYETNTEALLAEEFYSCKFGIPKALFLQDPTTRRHRDGLYAWVTQEQLDQHHESLYVSEEAVSNLLASLGLQFQYPIWAKDELFDIYCDQRLGTSKLLEIRSCNIISDYMEVNTFSGNQQWQRVKKELVDYSGLVWSLDVAKYKTYIANKIITHNCPFVQLQKQLDAEGEQRNVVPIGRTCPVETELLFEWVARYAEEFGVTDDPGNYTDQRVILELAECEVLEHRMNAVLAAKYQDLTEDKIVAVVYDENGEREQHVKDVADAMKVKEKIYTRKERLRKNLVATRYDQYKREAALNETNKVDAANLQADLRQKLQQIEAKIAGK